MSGRRGIWLRVAAVVAAVAIVAAACGDSSATEVVEDIPAVAPISDLPASDASSPTPATVAPDVEVVVASGSFVVESANGIGDQPGFHEVVTGQGTLSDGVGRAGSTLVFRLRDLTRPDLDCTSNHPLSGCATIDWSDFEERPRVPAGGAFAHRITIELESGPHDFFLSESGVLADVPDQYQPG